MNSANLGRWRVAALGVLATLMICVAVDRWALAREVMAREQLRTFRVQLQRAESRLATLAAAPVRLAAMTVSREALSLSILEAAARAAQLPGVTALDYRLNVDQAPISTLRLSVRASVVHEQALLDMLAALHTASPMRPRRVAGCRLLRGDDALVIACAIDWSWWSFS